MTFTVDVLSCRACHDRRITRTSSSTSTLATRSPAVRRSRRTSTTPISSTSSRRTSAPRSTRNSENATRRTSRESTARRPAITSTCRHLLVVVIRSRRRRGGSYGRRRRISGRPIMITRCGSRRTSGSASKHTRYAKVYSTSYVV